MIYVCKLLHERPSEFETTKTLLTPVTGTAVKLNNRPHLLSSRVTSLSHVLATGNDKK